MNSKTGVIREFPPGVLPDEYTELTELERIDLMKFPEEQRPAELALRRFIRDRKELGAIVPIEIKNAFRLGYRAGVKDQQG